MAAAQLCSHSLGERRRGDHSFRQRMSVQIPPLFLVLLVVLVIAALPTWPYSGTWGYYPSGGLGLVLVVILIVLLLGRRA